MQKITILSQSKPSAMQKRIFFVLAAIVFWLSFLAAVTPVNANLNLPTGEAPVVGQPIAGMATWHG